MTAAASRGAVGRGGALIAVPIQKHKERGTRQPKPCSANRSVIETLLVENRPRTSTSTERLPETKRQADGRAMYD